MGESEMIAVWGNLHRLYSAMRRSLDERLQAEAGCSLFDHDLLTRLDCASDRRMRMLELANRMEVTRGGLTRIIDRLVERGWVRRDRPESNRREVYALITDGGARTLDQARAVYLRVLDRTLGGQLSEDELAEFGNSTNKLLMVLGGDR
jgi:DNA-binding MarR family transcriptional regulator